MCMWHFFVIVKSNIIFADLFVLLALLLVLQMVLATSQPSTFTVAYINESSPTLPSPDTIRRSVIDCGVTCSALSSCYGFMFDNLVKKCTLLGCLNFQLFTGSQKSYFVPMSKLLARGTFSCFVVLFYGYYIVRNS